MAFFSKARGILQHTVTKHINREIAASSPSIFQLIRCMSSSKLFIGGLSYNTDETTLRETFEKYGGVIEAKIIRDRDTQSSRGFGFVTFEDTEAASSAIMALDGKDLQGRQIRVNYAHDKAGGGGGYGSYGGNYGSGGSYGGGGYARGGNYGNNYGGESSGGGGSYGAAGGSYDGGANYPSGGGGYASGSNYAGIGGNYGSGGSNHASGGGDYGSAGNFVSGNGGYDGGNNQNFGVAGGGGGGSDNYFADGSAGSSFAGTGYNNSGLNYGGGDQFSNSENVDMVNADGGNKQDDQLEGNFQDDNEPRDLLDRRAP